MNSFFLRRCVVDCFRCLVMIVIASLFLAPYVLSVASDGRGDGGRGLFILNSSAITVMKVRIQNQAQQGIYIQDGNNNKVMSGFVGNSQRPRIDESPGSGIAVTQRGNR